MQQSNPDLLEEFEKSGDLAPVSAGTRFANYLIDRVILSVLSYLVDYVTEIMTSTSDVYYEETAGLEWAVFYLLSWIAIEIGYFTLMEYSTKGRTIGKMATGTMAIREDGANLTLKDAFIRSLCRLIPFEPFSAIGGNPWHDRISKTLVIRNR